MPTADVGVQKPDARLALELANAQFDDFVEAESPRKKQ